MKFIVFGKWKRLCDGKIENSPDIALPPLSCFLFLFFFTRFTSCHSIFFFRPTRRCEKQDQGEWEKIDIFLHVDKRNRHLFMCQNFPKFFHSKRSVVTEYEGSRMIFIDELSQFLRCFVNILLTFSFPLKNNSLWTIFKYMEIFLR